MSIVRVLVVVALAGLGLVFLGSRRPGPSVPPGPPPVRPNPPPPTPAPAPPRRPRPCPGPGPCPIDGTNPAGARVGGARDPDGTEIRCDLPEALQLKNCGGSDGAGLCVFTSISHSARWQNVDLLAGFRDWMRRYPGGGYPEKVDRMIANIAREKGQPPPAYVQVEGTDLEVLKLACRTGRMPAVTYSFSPTGRYGGRRISHMVSLVHADDRHFVILDNNYPGESNYEWLTPEEFRKTYAPGWAVVLLHPAPPPPPRNDP